MIFLRADDYMIFFQGADDSFKRKQQNVPRARKEISNV